MFGMAEAWTRPCRAAAHRAARYECARALQQAQAQARAQSRGGRRRGWTKDVCAGGECGLFQDGALCVYRGGAQRSVVLSRRGRRGECDRNRNRDNGSRCCMGSCSYRLEGASITFRGTDSSAGTSTQPARVFPGGAEVRRAVSGDHTTPHHTHRRRPSPVR